MKISIALATFNGSHYLRDQLISFITQTQLPDEVIVCDDKSTDDTHEILKWFQNKAPFAVRIFHNTTQIGCTRNFENALARCSGDLIFLSDQDDVWFPTKVEQVSSRFKELNGVHVLINDAEYADSELNPLGSTVLRRLTRLHNNKASHIQGASTAITSAFKDFILPFPVDNCPQYDVYIHRWANLLSVKEVIINPLQYWRIHETNTSSTIFSRVKQVGFLEILSIYRGVSTVKTYHSKSLAFKSMIALLDAKNNELRQLCTLSTIQAAKHLLEEYVIALSLRAQIASSSGLSRRYLAIRLLFLGHYKHFYGFKSFLKDFIL